MLTQDEIRKIADSIAERFDDHRFDGYDTQKRILVEEITKALLSLYQEGQKRVEELEKELKNMCAAVCEDCGGTGSLGRAKDGRLISCESCGGHEDSLGTGFKGEILKIKEQQNQIDELTNENQKFIVTERADRLKIDSLEKELAEAQNKNRAFELDIYGADAQKEIEQLRNELAHLNSIGRKVTRFTHHGILGEAICEALKHSEYPCTCGLDEAITLAQSVGWVGTDLARQSEKEK